MHCLNFSCGWVQLIDWLISSRFSCSFIEWLIDWLIAVFIYRLIDWLAASIAPVIFSWHGGGSADPTGKHCHAHPGLLQILEKARPERMFWRRPTIRPKCRRVVLAGTARSSRPGGPQQNVGGSACEQRKNGEYLVQILRGPAPRPFHPVSLYEFFQKWNFKERIFENIGNWI